MTAVARTMASLAEQAIYRERFREAPRDPGSYAALVFS